MNNVRECYNTFCYHFPVLNLLFGVLCQKSLPRSLKIPNKPSENTQLQKIDSQRYAFLRIRVLRLINFW